MKTFFLSILFCIAAVSWAQRSYFEFEWDYKSRYLAEDVEKIIELDYGLLDDYKTIYEYEDGFLKKKTCICVGRGLFYRKYRTLIEYDYELSDSLWVIREKTEKNGSEVVDVTMAYFTDGRCDSTVWVDSKNRRSSSADFSKVSPYKVVSEREYYSGDTLFFEKQFGEEGHSCILLQKFLYKNDVLVYKSIETLCDKKEDDLFGQLVGGVVWSRERGDKQVIVYSDIDKHGNWRICDYLTERGKSPCSMRKIKYVKR